MNLNRTFVLGFETYKVMNDSNWLRAILGRVFGVFLDLVVLLFLVTWKMRKRRDNHTEQCYTAQIYPKSTKASINVSQPLITFLLPDSNIDVRFKFIWITTFGTFLGSLAFLNQAMP